MSEQTGRPWFAWVPRDSLSYLTAFVALIACLGARLATAPLYGDRIGYVMLVPAVLTGAALDGMGPVLMVMVLGMAATDLLTEASSFAPATNLLSALAFLLFCVLSGLGGDRLRRSRREREDADAGTRALLASVPDAMFVFDVRGAVQSFSASAAETFGWSAEAITGQPVWLLFPESSRDTIRDYLRSVEETGPHEVFGSRRVLQGQCRDGSVFPMELSVSRQEATRERLFTGFARDLSDRVAEQQRLRTLETDMMHRVRLNTMGQMATSLAHELNQPLAAATNFMAASARMLEHPTPDIPVVRAALQSGVEQTMRAGDIIRRLRGFVAKPEDHRSSENLADVIRDATVLAMVGNQHVALSLDLDPALGSLVIDRVQIQQVMVNLVQNAREATAQAERAALVVSARRVGDRVEVSVADTGPGVDPEIAPRVLDAFVTSKSGGLGVGLAISRDIIESHGGALWLDSIDTPGAVFRFTLPAALDGAAP